MCVGFISGRRFARSLEIPSLPAFPREAADAFWDGIRVFSDAHGVWDVEALSFASPDVILRPIGTTKWRRARTEYVLSLQESVGLPPLASNHARNVGRARKLGIAVRRSHDPMLAKTHVGLMLDSMRRRAERGEPVPLTIDARPFEALLRSGAAELFQALDGDEVRSSLLVLRATRGAYYQSAGTTLVGMEQGASHLLVWEIATVLRDEGVETFNLGGADSESGGLQRFKLGFGARPVALEAAGYALKSPVLRKARTAVRLLRRDPIALGRAILRIDRYLVFERDLKATGVCPDQTSDVIVRRLTDEEVRGLAVVAPEFVEHSRRFDRLRYQEAYGAFIQDTLAHVAWLIPYERDRCARMRHVKLQPGEVEITHCVTARVFRGRGIYTASIRSLSEVARLAGAHRVFMMTSATNVASKRGIERAGLRRTGQIVHITVVPIGERALVVWRGHRWSSRWTRL